MSARQLSELLGRSIVDAQGRRVGRLRDLVAYLDGEAPPPVIGALMARGSRDLFLPIHHLTALEPQAILAEGASLTPFARRPHQALLGRDVMDSQIVDLRHTRVARVNDVLLDDAEHGWRVVGVDLSMRALLRRMLPRALRGREGVDATLDWSDLELLASEIPGDVVAPDHLRLARRHPADIARIADAMPTRQAIELVASLDDDHAADTLEEMIDEKQANVIEELDRDRAAAILDRMAPDAAADVLAELQPESVDEVLKRMAPSEAADVHALLTYAKDTAGGLMTTDYVIARRDLLVSEVVGFLKPQLQKPDWVYYVYVVEDIKDRTLHGVFSLRDLLLAEPTERVEEIMTPVPHQISPTTPATTVARVMSEYNLMALPVVDEQRRLLGIVSVDDALELILPNQLRRRVPRVFS